MLRLEYFKIKPHEVGLKMTREGNGTVVFRETKTGDSVYRKVWLYIPASVANDSSFPFEHGEKVCIKIIGNNNLIVWRGKCSEKAKFIPTPPEEDLFLEEEKNSILLEKFSVSKEKK